MHSTNRDGGYWLPQNNLLPESHVPETENNRNPCRASVMYASEAKRWRSKERQKGLSHVERGAVKKDIQRQGTQTPKCYCKTKVKYANEIINTNTNSLPYDTQYSSFVNRIAMERGDSCPTIGQINDVPFHGLDIHSPSGGKLYNVTKASNLNQLEHLSDTFEPGNHSTERQQSQGHDQECFHRAYIHELPSNEPSGERNSQISGIYECNLQKSLQGKLRALQYRTLYGNKLPACYNISSASTHHGRYNTRHPVPNTAAAALGQNIPPSANRNILSTKAQYSITKTLLLTSTMFLLLNLPSHAIRVYGFFLRTWDYEPSNYSEWVLHNLQQLSIVLQHTHYGINFIFYSTCGSTFRKCLFSLLPVRLLRAVCSRKRNNASMYQ